MIDVIAFLIENFQDADACPSREHLGEILEEVGFDGAEIDDTLMLLDVLKHEPVVPAQVLRECGSLRVYCDLEMEMLPAPVRGLLHFLVENHALNPEQREFVVTALMSLPDEDITVDYAKGLALLVLWAQRSELPVLIGDELMAALNDESVMN